MQYPPAWLAWDVAMNDDLLNEIVKELRRQNVLLGKMERKQQELTWYLWLIALILSLSVLFPFLFAWFRTSG